jgi:hypothetical protein
MACWPGDSSTTVPSSAVYTAPASAPGASAICAVQRRCSGTCFGSTPVTTKASASTSRLWRRKRRGKRWRVTRHGKRWGAARERQARLPLRPCRGQWASGARNPPRSLKFMPVPPRPGTRQGGERASKFCPIHTLSQSRPYLHECIEVLADGFPPRSRGGSVEALTVRANGPGSNSFRRVRAVAVL